MKRSIHYFTIVAMLLSACCRENPAIQQQAQPDSAQTNGKQPTSTPSLANADSPWAGFEVTLAGTPLEQADQIVILLHGYGTKGEDLKVLADFLDGDKRAFIFPDGSVQLGPGRYSWATNENEQRETVNRVAELVRYTAAKYPKRRIALGGFSQGGTISSLLIFEQPNLPIQHYLLYSARLALTPASTPQKLQAKVHLAHGRADEVVPFNQAEQLHELLLQRGISVDWHPFDGGHTITDESLEATRQMLDEI